MVSKRRLTLGKQCLYNPYKPKRKKMIRILNQVELCCKPLVIITSSLSDLLSIKIYDINKGSGCYRFFESDMDYYIELCCNNYQKISTDKNKVFIFVEGVSHFEGQNVFYQCLLQDILRNYKKTPICLLFKPYYFSSSSQKHIVNLILALEKENEDLSVFWLKSDEESVAESKESGEDMWHMLGSSSCFVF